MGSTLWYTTLEAVKSALDIQATARNDAQVRRAVQAGTRAAEGLLLRRFRPWIGTRTFDLLTTRASSVLEFGRHELVAATTVTALDGTVIDSSDYTLVAARNLIEGDAGPPYTRIELDDGSAWPGGGATIAGVYGYRDDEETVGTLGATLGSASSATASVTWSTAQIGTGDLLRIDSERMIIRARTWVDSAQDLGGAGLTASMASVTAAVSSGSAFGVDEVIQIGSERMLVTAITGNNLTVLRAYDGSVLAAHTAGVDVYTLTGVELERGVAGTAAASHTSSATIYRHVVPGLVQDLAAAEAINQLQQETGGYGATRGSGESETAAGLGGLAAIRASAKQAYRRPRSWLGV